MINHRKNCREKMPRKKKKKESDFHPRGYGHLTAILTSQKS